MAKGKKSGKTSGLRDILSYNIKRYRLKKKLTQSGLARRAGLSMQMIKNLEVKRMFGTDASITGVARALEIEAWKLFMPASKKKISEKGKSGA